MAEVRWTENARDDLRGIHDFIGRDSPRAASTMVDRILAATDQVATFPESGRRLPEFPESAYREIFVGVYRVMYRYDGATVWIAAVVHGRRHVGGMPP